MSVSFPHVLADEAVLLVEDNPGDARLATMMLSEFADGRAARSHWVQTASDAVAWLSSRQPCKAVLLDLSLPDSTGLEALCTVLPHAPGVPVIVLTGIAGDELGRAALSCGAEDYLVKGSFDGRTLDRALSFAGQRKALESRLAAAAAEIVDLYENSPCGYHSLDAQGVFLHVNATAAQWLGCAREDLVGKRNILEFFTPEGQDTFGRNFERFKAQGRVEGLEFDLVPMVGLGRRVSVTATAVHESNGRFLMSRTSMFDITPIKEAEAARLRAVELDAENAKLRETNRLKDALLSNMSHELRTPLNAIIGVAQLLKSDSAKQDAATRLRHVNQICVSGQHLLQLIETMLDFAKAQSGKIEFTPVSVNVDAVVHDVVDMLLPKCEARQIEVSASVSDGLEDVRLDSMRLRQVLFSLLSNAVKFSHANGAVVVHATQPGPGLLRIDVADQGIGIDSNEMPRLFSRFHQISTGNTKAYEGTGLGLALVRRLVEAQGGEVGVISKLGVGSTFHVTLPCGQV